MNAPFELSPVTSALVDVGALDRREYMGGGDIAALMGLHPYRTPLDVYEAKTRDGPEPEPDADKAKLFRRGKLWEPIVVEMMRQDFGITVVRQNARYRDPEYPFMAAEIDFEWHDSVDPTIRNGEIKTCHPLAAHLWGEMETDEVPVHNAAQSMWGLMITRREVCQYGVVFGADDLTLYHVRRDDETIANMRAVAKAFWFEHVLPRIPPPPRTLGDLAKLYPRDTGGQIEAAPEIRVLLDEHASLAGRARAIEERLEEIKFAIGEFAKDNTTITVGGDPIATYKQQSRTSIATKELKAQMPAIYEQYSRETFFRVLRQKKGK